MTPTHNTDIPETVNSVIHDPKTHSLRLEPHETPTPSATQYLVQVHAVGITKGELLWLETGTLSYPIPGFDVAGTVVTSPSTDSKFQPGDKVYALTAFDRPANARQITVVDEKEIAKLPKGMSFTDAAAIPMSALTAREALFDKGGLVAEQNSPMNKDRSVLIIAASGAVGIWATQMAKWSGVGRIVGMCGASNAEFVKSLGADEVIDHRETSLSSWVTTKSQGGKFSLVLDGVGGDTLKEAWLAVEEQGTLLSIVQPVEASKPDDGISKGVKGNFFIVEPSGSQLEKITESIESGLLKPVVDSVFGLDDFQKAFDKVGSGRARGKVILDVR